MSVKIRDFLRVWIEIVVSLFGVAGYVTQSVQYFTGRWGNPFYQEVFMFVLFFIFSLHMNRVIDLFKAFVSRISKTPTKESKRTPDIAKAGIIGEGIDETNM